MADGNVEESTKQPLALAQDALVEKLVLGEIDGKNKAIHAYDAMVWKIRSGFLTLLFGGWSILLKAIVESSPSAQVGKYGALVNGLLVFSFGFASGAWFIDRSYVRRKFRVILALDRLTTELITHGSDMSRLSGLLHVAGDNGDMPFDSRGYREATTTVRLIYLVPLATLVVGIALVARWWY